MTHPPVQELVGEGLVAPHTAAHGPVNFVSHQWVGFTHPDPSSHQLAVIQGMSPIAGQLEL